MALNNWSNRLPLFVVKKDGVLELGPKFGIQIYPVNDKRRPITFNKGIQSRDEDAALVFQVDNDAKQKADQRYPGQSP